MAPILASPLLLGENYFGELPNVVIQARSYDIADAKFQGGTATELDAAQAASLLQDTQAQIPALETSIRQTQNTLCTLLG